MHIVLAEEGAARAEIMIAATADRVVRFAARELAAYFERMTEAIFPITESLPADEAQTIFITTRNPASSRFSAANCESLENCGTDAFAIKAGDGSVCIRGTPSRGVLYGVYELLERLGCRFIEPGRERVPYAPRLTLANMSIESSAAFSNRNLFRIHRHGSQQAPYWGLDPEHHLPQIDWMAKRRLNHYVFYVDHYRLDLWEKHKDAILDALLDRGFEIEVTMHSIQYFCPPDENMDYGNHGDATYRHRHPDWYLPTYTYGHSYQVRVELPAVRNVITSRCRDYLHRNPEVGTIAAWPSDVSVNRPETDLSHTDGYMRFWNALADNVARADPGKRISIPAYMELQAPPEQIAPAENLLCWYCPIDANYHYPLAHERNRDHLSRLAMWCKAMAPESTMTFEYYGWMPPLTPLVAKMQADLCSYRELGLAGVYGWSGFSYNLMGDDYRWSLECFTLPHLLWNPQADTEALRKDWAKEVFASAAGPVTDLYHFLERTHQAEKVKGLFSNDRWITLDVLRKAQCLFDAARRVGESADAVERIDLMEALMCGSCTAMIHRQKPNPLMF